MQPMSFASRIREAYEQSLGSPPALARLAGHACPLRADRGLGQEQEDRLLEAAVRAYRRERCAERAALVLELVAPPLTLRLADLRPVPPAITDEDLAQQMLVEHLWAAATMPLPDGAGFVERRLVLRAGDRVSRWLEREARRRAHSTELVERC